MGGLPEFHPNGRRILSAADNEAVRQWEAFPWRESDYPSTASEPLADRIRHYATVYWRERLEAEARADQPEGRADRVVFVPFDRSSLPRRDPLTPAHLLDLTEHYTGGLIGLELFCCTVDYNNDLRELPSGRFRFEETEFDIRGLIRAGSFIAPSNPMAPFASDSNRTGPIAVGRLVSRLHVLGGVTLETSSEGTTVARLVWRYADGGQSETQVVYGQHLRNLWVDRDPNSEVPAGRVAWTGLSPYARDVGTQIRLYHFTLENPRPDVEVTSLQWIGGISISAPFIVAMTVEPGS